jgi:hypothetical protein
MGNSESLRARIAKLKRGDFFIVDTNKERIDCLNIARYSQLKVKITTRRGEDGKFTIHAL